MFLAALATVLCTDGFETAALGGMWTSGKFAPGAVEMQSKVVRAGRGAARIVLRPGDWTEANDHPGGPVLERAELQEAPGLWAEQDKTYTYAFSLRLPEDFPALDNRLVIAQWKQKCPQETCVPGGPLLAIRYNSGELRITAGATLYSTREEIRGRWLDFRFRIRFADAGRVEAWLNGRQVVDYSGPLVYPEKGGYPARNRFYFKAGLYRDRIGVPMVMFLDEYRKTREIPVSDTPVPPAKTNP